MFLGRGPNIEPWGTPVDRGCDTDVCFCHDTLKEWPSEIGFKPTKYKYHDVVVDCVKGCWLIQPDKNWGWNCSFDCSQDFFCDVWGIFRENPTWVTWRLVVAGGYWWQKERLTLVPSAGLCTTVVWASWGEVGDTLPCRDGMGGRKEGGIAKEYQHIPWPQR